MAADAQPANLRGRTATVVHRVGDADSATAVGSGDVPVLATPRLIALAEAATVAAVADQLPAGTTSVGTRVELDHRQATPLGATVTVVAAVAAADGRRLAFDVEARDDARGPDRVVATGRVERVVVDRGRFVAGLQPAAPADPAGPAPTSRS